MKCRQMLVQVLVIGALAGAAPIAAAQSRPDAARAGARDRAAARPAQTGDFWVSLGGGAYTGEEYEQPANDPNSSSYDVGGYAAHASFNMSNGDVLLRVRSSWLFDYTNNTAEEVGVSIGLPLARDRSVWASVGVSRLTDVSFTQQSPTVGVPVDLAFYPTRGLELLVHGNLNDDSNFIGVAISGVIGKDRRR